MIIAMIKIDQIINFMILNDVNLNSYYHNLKLYDFAILLLLLVLSIFFVVIFVVILATILVWKFMVKVHFNLLIIQ